MPPTELEIKAVFDLRVQSDHLPPPLRPYVREVYETGVDVPPGEVFSFPISATTEAFLNVSLSDPVFIRIGQGFRLPPVALAGPQAEAYTFDMAGSYRGFYVRFAPVGPLALLGVEDYSLEDGRARPLHALVPPELTEAARAWEDALIRAASFEDRVALTTHFLLAHRRPLDRRTRVLSAAVEAIEEAGGDVRIRDLARRLGVGESTLRRYFGALGMAPKRFAAVVRFRHAHAYLHTTPGATWRDAVARFGYADQAHFVRDHHRFSGTPPTRWNPERRAVDRRMGIETPPDDAA